jgi:cytochrome c-type biogenesis protein CcmH/NrfF
VFSVVGWWVIPVIAVMSAVVWTSWVSRRRARLDPHDDERRRQRFRDAIERGLDRTKADDTP